MCHDSQEKHAADAQSNVYPKKRTIIGEIERIKEMFVNQKFRMNNVERPMATIMIMTCRTTNTLDEAISNDAFVPNLLFL